MTMTERPTPCSPETIRLALTIARKMRVEHSDTQVSAGYLILAGHLRRALLASRRAEAMQGSAS